MKRERFCAVLYYDETMNNKTSNMFYLQDSI